MTIDTPRNRAARRERKPLLTSVVGSYSVPEWLGHYNTDFRRGRISAELLQEIHGTAIKAALIDQGHAGVDIVSDGEFRRDNDMDYFVERIPGITVVGGPKSYYYDYLTATVDTSRCRTATPHRPSASSTTSPSRRRSPTRPSRSRSPDRSPSRTGSTTSSTRATPASLVLALAALLGARGHAASSRRGRPTCRSTSRSSPATPSASSSRCGR